MANTNLRIESKRYAKKGPINRSRQILAAVLVLATVSAAYLVFTRDVSWERRNSGARRQGLNAVHNGNFLAARDYFQNALANHPYDWRTHYNLANIQSHRLNDPEAALKHYLYTLAYCPESAILARARAEVDILRLVRSGELENPADALNDMFDSAEGGARWLFEQRLSLPARGEAEAYWQGWRKRGRGMLANLRIRIRGESLYDAYMEVRYPDGTVMSMHFTARLRDIWRLSLAFP